jgi:hypothetical protein
MKQVTALFKSGEAAKDGVDALIESSFPSDSISVLMKQHREVTPIEVEQKTGVPLGMAAGGAIGAALGLTAVVAFPGLLAAGPALAALTGAGGGAFAGAFQGLGWWKLEADIPERAIEDGAVLVGVAAPNERCEEAIAVLRRAGAEHVDAL